MFETSNSLVKDTSLTNDFLTVRLHGYFNQNNVYTVCTFSKHYTDGAIIMSDEIQIIIADIIGLGAIDFR